jgi:hypothetical protein
MTYCLEDRLVPCRDMPVSRSWHIGLSVSGRQFPGLAARSDAAGTRWLAQLVRRLGLFVERWPGDLSPDRLGCFFRRSVGGLDGVLGQPEGIDVTH